MSEFQTISNQYLTVRINLLGAELWSICDNDGTEYLWQGAPEYWQNRSPVLFPYIGRMVEKSYLFNGNKYGMDIHGFAKNSQFRVVDCQRDSVTLCLSENTDSLEQYPFSFDFYVAYQLVEKNLSITYKVINKSRCTMYFGVGGHPGFNVPLEQGLCFEDYYVEFPVDCTPKRVQFSANGFVLDKEYLEYPLQYGRRYPLTHDLFKNDAIVLLEVPKQICLCTEKGTKKVTVHCPDMTYLGLWQKPNSDAPYLCIEPWTSLPSRDGIIENLDQQKTLLKLPEGEVYENQWSISFL